jgi:hypothetical protein
MGKVEDIARRYFPKDFTDREKSYFRGGHSSGGPHTLRRSALPAASTVAPYIEKALAKSFMLQPYRREVKVRLRRIPRRPRLYRYGTVSPENIEAEVVVEYGSARVRARMGYVKELKYPSDVRCGGYRGKRRRLSSSIDADSLPRSSL